MRIMPCSCPVRRAPPKLHVTRLSNVIRRVHDLPQVFVEETKTVDIHATCYGFSNVTMTQMAVFFLFLTS